MAQLTLAEGSVFGGRYKIVRCMAMGGMGAVYEVIHLETERRRALKVMLPHVVGSEDLRNRFRQEARVAAHIESQHIVDVFDAGVDDATAMPFLVMELLQGEELGHLLKRTGRFAPKDVVTYIHQTALALDKTHRANIVHRDLKPENLFLTHREDGQPHIKVLDFGIAKIMADSSTQAAATRSLGTPLYMAPEQFRTNIGISPAADIYALGMMVFTLLVGAPYWHQEMQNGGNVFAFAMTTSGGPPEPASTRAARFGVTLPPAFDAWFAKATAVQAANRFPSAGAAAVALGEALGFPVTGSLTTSGPMALEGSQQLTAPSTSASFPTSSGASLTPTPAQPSNNRVIIGASIAAFVVAGAVASGFLITRNPTDRTPGSASPEPQKPTASASGAVTVSPSTPLPATAATATTTASETAAPVASATAAPAHTTVAPAAHPTTPKATPTVKAAPAVTAKIHSRD